MTSEPEREIARLLNESDPAAQELAKLTAGNIVWQLQPGERRLLKVLVQHFPQAVLDVL